MKKSSILIIIGVVAAITIGITVIGLLYNGEWKVVDSPTLTGRISSESISSGPITLTKPQYKIRENIFYIVDGLKEDDKGTLRFFVPDGRLYRSIDYDGSIKSSFNQYFRPDTSYLTEFCEQEEFVGEWLITFDNDAYPPLKFEILNEHMSGPGNRLIKAC